MILMIFGGTGTLGSNMVREYLSRSRPPEVVVFSRDEQKQEALAAEWQGNPHLHLVLGDVRSYTDVSQAVCRYHPDKIVYAAALKSVPYCEKFPFQAIQTNILGAENVLQAAIANRIGRVVSISTDKSPEAINVMGMTKALQERMFLASGKRTATLGTDAVVVRFGNVLGSRGSVAPFGDQRGREGKTIPITHPMMTRFLFTQKQAVDLVEWALISPGVGRIYLPKMRACRMDTMAEVFSSHYHVEKEPVGRRPGEKLHECLHNEEEFERIAPVPGTDDYMMILDHTEKRTSPNLSMPLRSDMVPHMEFPELRELLMKEGFLI